uniref:Uncharacterized protein n=1 Tax=Hucho hucho TaxID=62062 RepID=A0A4W5ND95_9TELE
MSACSGCQHGLWNCSLEPCPVDGGLSTWGPWSPCSLSCGGLGLKTRNRACSHPAPAYGGRDCLGPRQESTYCQAMDCPVDGGWSRWSPWSRCDKRCGGGRSIRTRSCFSPPPKNGGRKCEGEKNQVKPCNTKPCEASCTWNIHTHTHRIECLSLMIKTRNRIPSIVIGCVSCQSLFFWLTVDGGWTPWSVWSDCPVTCGRGTQIRSRACINPPPRNNGTGCSGPERDAQGCHIPPCLGNTDYCRSITNPTLTLFFRPLM